MLSIGEYREKISDLGSLLSRWDTCSLEDVARRPVPPLSAEAVAAQVHVPPFDNSQMDGFVVHPDDPEVRAGGPVPLQPMVAAGHAPEPLKPGHAMPIMTGAKIPDWAGATSADEDPRELCVVPVEETVAGFDGLGSVTFTPDAVFEAGRFVRRMGSDLQKGEQVCAVGDRLTPGRVGSLASVGVTSLRVYEPLRVLVVSTGDEVCQPGQDRGEAQIFDANTSAAVAAMTAAGAHVVGTLHAPDRPEVLLDAVREWQREESRRADVVVSMGGISKGAREVIRLASELEIQRGAQNVYSGARSARLPESGMEFCAVAMQPGGPQGVGMLAGVPWVALPGNPVSTLVSIEMFARGALFGAPARAEVEVTVRTAGREPMASPRGKAQMRYGRMRGGEVWLPAGNSSHLLHRLADADTLVMIPADVDVVRDGDSFTALAV